LVGDAGPDTITALNQALLGKLAGEKVLRLAGAGQAQRRRPTATAGLPAGGNRHGTHRLLDRTRQRLAGTKVIPDRLISLADPDARPIRKGKPNRPTELGMTAPRLPSTAPCTLRKRPGRSPSSS
jgi:hypothetical protein